VSIINKVSSPKFWQEGGIVVDPRCRRLKPNSSPVSKPGVAWLESAAGFLTRLLIGLNSLFGGSPTILASCQNFGDDILKNRILDYYQHQRAFAGMIEVIFP
jgi:hypothetical protein